MPLNYSIQTLSIFKRSLQHLANLRSYGYSYSEPNSNFEINISYKLTCYVSRVSTHLVTNSKFNFESAFERQAVDILDKFGPYKFHYGTNSSLHVTILREGVKSCFLIMPIHFSNKVACHGP